MEDALTEKEFRLTKENFELKIMVSQMSAHQLNEALQKLIQEHPQWQTPAGVSTPSLSLVTPS